MSRFKRSFLSPHQLYKSLYVNPLGDSSSEHNKHERLKAGSPVSGLHLCRGTSVVCDNVDIPKENKPPKPLQQSCKKVIDADECVKLARRAENGSSIAGKEGEKLLREPLQSLSENVSSKPKIRSVQNLSEALAACPEVDDALDEKAPLFAPPTPNRPLHVWDDDPDCDAGPASSWSTLANRFLLCRPLPLDVGRCACYILHEREAGADSPIVYSLYTDEGHGRQDRKLAVARHRRKAGRSEFIMGQNGAGTSLAKREEGFLGRVRANLVGSRYYIWDEATALAGHFQGGRQLLGVVMFEPTVATLTGTFRVMRVYIPKYQSLQMSNATQNEQNGLAKDWEGNIGKVHELCSRKPCYNREKRRYELDFRDRTRPGSKIKSSAKNFQLIMEEHGKQVILLHGQVGKSKYVMEYRFPLTAFQAFGICLASIDSKLCCSV